MLLSPAEIDALVKEIGKILHEINAGITDYNDCVINPPLEYGEGHYAGELDRAGKAVNRVNFNLSRLLQNVYKDMESSIREGADQNLINSLKLKRARWEPYLQLTSALLELLARRTSKGWGSRIKIVGNSHIAFITDGHKPPK